MWAGRLAVASFVAVAACSSFGSDTGTSTPTSSDAGAGADAGASWCATNKPNAVFCDDFETDWSTNGKGWDPRGAVERVDRAPGDKALHVHAVVQPNIADTVIALFKSFPGGPSHVAYSFDFQVVKLTPADSTVYYSVPLSILEFAKGDRSTVDLEHVPPGGPPVEWNLRVTGNGGQPTDVVGGAGFPGGAWRRIYVESRSLTIGSDTVSVRYEGVPSPTQTNTSFAVGEDITLSIGVATGVPGEIDYLFDNFSVDALD